MSANSTKKTYLIIGGSGYLGNYFIKNLLNSGNKIIATYSNNESSVQSDDLEWHKLDIGNLLEIDQFAKLLTTHSNLRVIFLSAYHHPDRVSAHPDLAFHINVTALSYFLTKVKNIETLYYSSTESVYGESSEGHLFCEHDNTVPANMYGRQKLIAEAIVLAHGFNVIRYAFLIGPSLTPKPHFFDYISNEVKEKRMIDMMSDFCRNPIDFDQASSLTIELIDAYGDKQIGIVNMSGDEILSKYQIAQRVVRYLGLENEYLNPITSDEFGGFNAFRAKDTLVNNGRLKELLALNDIKLNFENAYRDN
jgi:dTDP-4-dehydrorhamnose reductase